MKKRVNTYLIITAMLLIVLGVVSVFNPKDIFAAVSWLVGLLILLSGVFGMLFGMRAKEYLPSSGSTTLLAMFQVVVGIIFLLNGVVATKSLEVIFALWVLFEGISLSVLSFEYRRVKYKYWYWMLILGAVSMALGFIALCQPDATGTLLGVLLGIGILTNGVVRLVAFVALKNIEKHIAEIQESANAINIDDINKQ